MVNMVKVKDTHLTEKQFEILRLKIEGKTLTEISRELGTTKANISKLAKIAQRNIERARNTLKLIETIEWPIKINVKAGSNIYSASERVFRKADEKGIRICRNYSEVVKLITEALGKTNLNRRKTLKDFCIMVSNDGKVEILRPIVKSAGTSYV